MSDIHAAINDLTSAVEEKVVELGSAKRELLSVASDLRHSAISGVPFGHESKEQRVYREVFTQWMQEPSGGNNASLMRQCVNDLGKKDVTIASVTGSYAVPKFVNAQWDYLATNENPWLDPAVLGVEEVNTSDAHWPLSMSDGTITRTTESAARGATNTPTFRERTVSWGEYFCYAQASNNAREDLPRLEAFLVGEYTRQIAAVLAGDIIAGSGSSGQVLGLTGTTPTTTSDAASPMRAAGVLQYGVLAGATLVVADLKKFLALFQESYLNSPDFCLVMRPTTWQSTVLGATDGPTDAPFLMKNPPTFNGYPVRYTSAAPAVGSNAYAIIAGAFKRGYILASRGPMLMTIDEVTNPGWTRYFMRRRFGGAVRQSNACKVLKFATS